MKNLYILLLLPLVLWGQDTSQNYVKTHTYHDDVTTSNVQVDVTYFDGMGRPIQMINGKASATGKDIITHMAYNDLGIQPKEFLPYPGTTTNQYFDSSAEQNTLAFYNTAGYDNTANPYTQTFYEPSPLNRVRKVGAPGTAWMGNAANDADHAVKYVYQTNVSNEVKRLYATATWSSSLGLYNPAFYSDGFYAVGQLYKTITRDENWVSGTGHTTEEFKNRQGQVVLKRTYNNGVKHDTYYVYDQFGNLTYVLPPLAEGALVTDLCYYYKYDVLNRVVEKKVPGKQWEFIVYDQLDRVVATGPAYSPFGDGAVGWMYNHYDSYDRLCLTGWYPQAVTNTTRKTLQVENNGLVTNLGRTTAYNLDNAIVNYKPPVLPNGYKILAVYYYDDYSWSGAPTVPSAVESQSVMTAPKGLSTGGWTRAVTTATETLGEINCTLYDGKKLRPIRTRVTNHLGGYTEIDTNYDFDGSVVYTINKHKRVSGSTEIVVREDFTYTPQFRLLEHMHKINSLASQRLVKNEYDELGRLVTKNVGQYSQGGLVSTIQAINFKYNIRGWLTDINNVDNLGSDKFAFRISYNTVAPEDMGDDISMNIKPLYNGNISETYWRSGSDNVLRKYSYNYDQLDRLMDAYYQKPEQAVKVPNSYYEGALYDKNGNIEALGRLGGLDDPVNQIQIDDLMYTYDATNKNRLLKVTDVSSNPQGFKDNASPHTGDDYTYDDNGNLKSDRNKGITLIKYNHLNLPVEIVFDNSSTKKITYIYNALGSKLKKTVVEGNVTVEVDYLTGYQYKNGVLQFFPTAEGYVENTVVSGNNTYSYVYQYKDHLGNIRMDYSYARGGKYDEIAFVQIKEENHYYPFGLKHHNYNMDFLEYQEDGGEVILYPPLSATGKLANNYMYNGKELQDEIGLNWYDYQARNYDPALGRWMNVDPLAEVSRRWSPYTYCYNNPMVFVDPDGMLAGPTDWIKWSNNEGQTFITYDSGVKSASAAENKGYTNIEEVFEESTASSDLGETFDFRKGGIYNVNEGTYKNAKEETYITEGGTIINANKSYTQQVGAIFSGIGDYTAYGAAGATSTGVGAPVGAVLGTVSAITGGVGAGLDVLDGIFNSETINMDNPEQAVTKTVTNVLAPLVLNRAGLNNIEGPIIDMLLMSADKTIDHGRDNLVGPFYPEDDK